MVEPISPDQITDAHKKTIPDEIIAIFNDLIAAHWNGSSSTVKQQQALEAVCSKLNVKSDEVFKKHWMDIEDIYEAAGWKVKYDKPGYNESYDAYFEFSKKKKNQ